MRALFKSLLQLDNRTLVSLFAGPGGRAPRTWKPAGCPFFGPKRDNDVPIHGSQEVPEIARTRFIHPPGESTIWGSRRRRRGPIAGWMTTIDPSEKSESKNRASTIHLFCLSSYTPTHNGGPVLLTIFLKWIGGEFRGHWSWLAISRLLKAVSERIRLWRCNSEAWINVQVMYGVCSFEAMKTSAKDFLPSEAAFKRQHF